MYSEKMIRTQIYLDPKTHKRLLNLAKTKKTSMAQIVRESVEEKIEKEEKKDTSGIEVMLRLANIRAKGGPKDLSTNIDHYLYGFPKKKVKST